MSLAIRLAHLISTLLSRLPSANRDRPGRGELGHTEEDVLTDLSFGRD